MYGSHVGWQKQRFPRREKLYCSCHPTWLPCKRSINIINSCCLSSGGFFHLHLSDNLMGKTRLYLQLSTTLEVKKNYIENVSRLTSDATTNQPRVRSLFLMCLLKHSRLGRFLSSAFILDHRLLLVAC